MSAKRKTAKHPRKTPSAQAGTAIPLEILVELTRYDGRSPLHLHTDLFKLSNSQEQWQVSQLVPPSAIRITRSRKERPDVTYILNLRALVERLAAAEATS